ncbi:MAG: tyrosine recombinase XerC [Chlamydiia bacterium]|nr:tyrosine recombinase XerC [Chlamydiia bacterium]
MISEVYKFLAYLRHARNASEHTIRNYAADLNQFKLFLQKEYHPECPVEELPKPIDYRETLDERWRAKDGLLSLENIETRTIRKYLVAMQEEGLKSTTVGRRLSSLQSFFAHCMREGWAQLDPVEGIERPRATKSLPHSLKYEQVEVLFEQPDTSDYLGLRDRAIIELFYSSGLRVSELVALNRDDIDRGEMMIRIRGKGAKERCIPITDNALSWVDRYLNDMERHLDVDGHSAEVDTKAIFLNRHGTRITARSVDRNFQKYLKKSGLSDQITPHTIRHTIATHWLENGMDLKSIQAILGHTSVAATTIYTHVSAKLKQETHTKSHPRSRKLGEK